MIDISEQIKILRKQNRTVKDICQIVGKSESTVRRYVRALGLQKNTAREDIDSAVVYDMYVNKGYTVVEIAKYFDCAHDTIEKRLLSQGIVINKVENIKRHFDRVYDEQWENIKRDLDNRMSRSAVCSKYHMRMSSLDRLMKRHDYGCAVNYVSKIEEKLCVCDNVGEKRYLESMKEYYTEYQIIPTVSGLADFMKLHRTTVFGAVRRYSLSELVQVNVQSGYVSRLEADLTKLGVSFEKNNRIILDGYELDFYIDELKLGIEVNPVGTHSVDIPVYGISNRYYHQNKALLAEKKGIGLLHLYDIDFVYEYRYKRLLRLIESRLHLKQKCGARECLVKMIDRHTAVEFLEMFHLQGGETTSSYRYGLYYKDELVSVLTVGKSRYTDDEYEIIRYCPKPDMIIAGCSAYSREIDFKRFKEIADKCDAYLMVDMAHIAGLVAAGLHQSPFPYADVVTSTTHKTLRGPRGGIILTNSKEIINKINKTIFPRIQGGPLMHVIGAKAECFYEALQKEFVDYQKQVVKNAKAMANSFINDNVNIISGGTDNHMFLVDVKSSYNISGKLAEKTLDNIHITCNKNTIP